MAGESHTNSDGTPRQEIIATLNVGDEVYLKREPTNPYDGNAIAVVSDGGMVGYVSKGQAKRLAAAIDAGQDFSVRVRSIAGGTPDKPFRGLWLDAEPL